MHSIGAALLLKKEEIHFFDDIAYYHVPFTHCPTGEQRRLDLKCSCNPSENFDWKGYSCVFFLSPFTLVSLYSLYTGTTRFFDLLKLPKPVGYELQQD